MQNTVVSKDVLEQIIDVRAKAAADTIRRPTHLCWSDAG
jgi:hypothetical protein